MRVAYILVVEFKLRVAYILVVEFQLRVGYILVVEFKLRVAHILVVKLNKNDTLTTRIKRFYYILKEKEVLSTLNLKIIYFLKKFLTSANQIINLERPNLKFDTIFKFWPRPPFF